MSNESYVVCLTSLFICYITAAEGY